MIRIQQKWTAALGALAIVFAQLAVAAHACVLQPAAPAAASAAQAMDAGCDRMDAAQRALCERHCRDEAQSQSQFSPQMAALDFTPAFWVPIAALPALGAARAPAEPSLARATSPPPLTRNRRLLI